MVSVNTNGGAITAVSTLRSIDLRFVTFSKRIESGFRVADAFDDASTFAVAQGIRANIHASAAVQSSLSQAQGVVGVALSGLQVISDLTAEIKEKLILLADGSITGSARATLKADTQELYNQIFLAQNAASYNGRSQLIATATSLSFVADTTGETITVGTFNGQTEYTDLGTAIDNITDSGTAQLAYAALEPFEQRVAETNSSLSATGRRLGLQQDFLDELVHAAKRGLGVLVDSDISEAAAIRASVVVQRGLALAALDLANTSSRRIVNILR